MHTKTLPGSELMKQQIEYKRIKYAFTKAEEAQINWYKKWSWILEEQKLTKDALKVYKKPIQIPADKRKAAPVPLTTNRMYGWISSKKEFNLQKYGPDVTKSPPIPDIYKLPKHSMRNMKIDLKLKGKIYK